MKPTMFDVDVTPAGIRGRRSPWAMVRDQAALASGLPPESVPVQAVSIGPRTFASIAQEERIFAMRGFVDEVGPRCTLNRSLPPGVAVVFGAQS